MKLFSFFSSFITTNHIDIGTRYLLFCIMTLFLVLFSCILALFFQIYSSAFILFLTLSYCFSKQYNLLVLIQITIFFRLLWFFTPLSEIVSMTSPYRSFTCVFSILSYLFFLRYHKYFVLWISIVLRLFLVVGVEDLGTVYLGGGLISTSMSKDIITLDIPKHGIIPVASNFNFFNTLDEHQRVPIRTNETFLNKWSEHFPSFSMKFFEETYLQKNILSLKNDVNVIKNFTLNQGAVFSNLEFLHKETLKYYSLNSENFEYSKDAFFYMLLLKHYSVIDLPFLINLGQYNFHRENIIMLTGLSEKFDMDVIKTFNRTYGSYDGTIVVNNKILKIDCYSPMGRPDETILKDKRNSETGLILMGNMKDDFSKYSTDRVLGIKGNTLSNIPIVRNINDETAVLVRDKYKPIILSNLNTFTFSLNEFKEVKK